MLVVLLMSSTLVLSAVVEMALQYPWNGLMVLMVWWLTAVLSALHVVQLQ